MVAQWGGLDGAETIEFGAGLGDNSIKIHTVLPAHLCSRSLFAPPMLNQDVMRHALAVYDVELCDDSILFKSVNKNKNCHAYLTFDKI